MADKEDNIVKVADVWQRNVNPLRNLTSQDIEHMLEQASRGNDVRLQMCFELLEKSAPIFGICIKKRLAGISSRKWDVVPIDTKSSAAFAQAQKAKEMLETADGKVIDNFSEAIEWLSMSAFRGRSAMKPFVHEDGTLSFKKIMPWHLLMKENKLYWNPDGSSTIVDPSSLQEVPFNEVCLTLDGHPVDWPGITVYLRQLVGETKWAQFIERQGIPQVVLEAPDGTPDTALEEWTRRAWQILQGGSGVMPAGGKVNELVSARGQDPFSNFCSHQSEIISILATGGTLLTIGGSTGLGSELAKVQKEQFDQLVTNDCKKVQNALNGCLMPKIAEHLGQELLCRFQFTEDEDINVAEYISYAKELKSMGIPIDIDKFKKLTKLEFIATNAPTEESSSELWQPVEQEEASTES